MAKQESQGSAGLHAVASGGVVAQRAPSRFREALHRLLGLRSHCEESSEENFENAFFLEVSCCDVMDSVVIKSKLFSA
jgi:hypothetical protein